MPTVLTLSVAGGVLAVFLVLVTLAYHMLSTPAQAPKESTLPATTKKMTTQSTFPTATTQPPPLPSPMICTFNILKFTKQSVLPSDGTCDIIFLDALYRNNNNPLSEFPLGIVEEFLVVANKSKHSKQKTKMGLALDSHSPGYESIMAGSDVTDTVKAMWEKYGCSYYGALDGNIRAFDSPSKTDVLWKPLSLMRAELMKVDGAKDDYAVVFGVTSTDMVTFREKLVKDMKNAIGLTHFVIVSHTSYANYGLPAYNDAAHFDTSNCLIVPPSIYYYQSGYNTSHYSTMIDSSEFLEYLLKPATNLSVPISISVTLKGRWFKAGPQPPQSLDLFKRCDNFTSYQDEPPFSVCQGGSPGLSYKNSSGYKSVFLANSTKVFTFEAERTLRDKICELKDLLGNAKLALAVYDIDADTDAKPCPQVLYTGQYKRLALLRKLNDFMARYTNVVECKRVT